MDLTNKLQSAVKGDLGNDDCTKNAFRDELIDVLASLDKVRDKLEELQGYAIDDEDNGEPQIIDESTGLRLEDTF